MILVFDVGNTNMVIGVWEGKQLLTHWRLRTDSMRTADEYGMTLRNLFEYQGLDAQQIKAVVISSVVPFLMMELEVMSEKYFRCQPLVVGPGIKTGLAIKYENPREVGADRVVNAVAGFHKYGGPLIIVDFGTATTFCVVSSAGEYLGGAIAPGIKISTEALVNRASKLGEDIAEAGETLITSEAFALIPENANITGKHTPMTISGIAIEVISL